MAKSKPNKNSSGSRPKTRKEIRKEERMMKKQRRNRNWKPQQCEETTKVADEPTATKKAAKKTAKKDPQQQEVHESTHDKLQKERKKDEKDFKKLERQMKNQWKRHLIEANKSEDRVIRDLEKKLKLNRRKSTSIPQSFVSEGLDYLLEVCDYDKFKDSINLESALLEPGDEFENDLDVVTGSTKNRKPNSEEQESADEVANSDNESDTADSIPEDQASNDEIQDDDDDSENEESENELGDISDDEQGAEEEQLNEDDSYSEGGSESECEAEPVSKKKKLNEDIYGRLRDQKGNILKSQTGKYIPPHLRAQPTTETSEDMMQLAKHMKGLLNRLTDRNMHSIATQMEELYVKHSRHDVNSTLLKLLTDSLLSSILSPTRIVIEHAMLITILHANIGEEIGATVLEYIVHEFVKLLQENLSIEDKRLDNVTLVLCQMYHFKIFHARLMYDVLDRLVERFDEKNIELVLVILKNVGFILRKDDPTAMKDCILKIQKQANESTELRENARVRFMMDTLTAIKNNNTFKVKDYDPSYVDHLKKIQKSLLRGGKYVTELKISLEDIINADSKGKWWIVGSAWSGDKNDKSIPTSSQSLTFSEKYLELARKHRMNTDTRRNIFCTLMSAESYLDACEKLLKLPLRGNQYQEIIHVLMHCVVRLKKCNPYYVYVAERLCDLDRKYKIALQFSLWDKLKEIDSIEPESISPLAKFLSYLIVEQKLPLSVLKVLEFTEMKKRMVRLLRQILLGILLTDKRSVVEQTFARISKSDNLFRLREGLTLFLHQFVLKNAEAYAAENESEQRKLHELPERVECAVNAMRNVSLRSGYRDP